MSFELRFYKLSFTCDGQINLDLNNYLSIFLPVNDKNYEPLFIQNLNHQSVKHQLEKGSNDDGILTTDSKVAKLLETWVDRQCLQKLDNKIALEEWPTTTHMEVASKTTFWKSMVNCRCNIYEHFGRTCYHPGLTFDPFTFGYFYLQLISKENQFRFLFENAIRKIYSVPSSKDVELFVYVKSNFVCPIDYQWNKILERSIRERVELEYALSWLSTLGGAFSAMGDVSANWAVEAGLISLRQLKIAMRLKDPLVAARCRLYAAISLLQQGYLKSAREIVENEYGFAKSLPEDQDPRLIRMCLGVWTKLQYHWKLAHEEKRKS